MCCCRKNDPEVLERRQKDQEALEAAVAHMLQHNPGRMPRWDAQRIMQASGAPG